MKVSYLGQKSTLKFKMVLNNSLTRMHLCLCEVRGEKHIDSSYTHSIHFKSFHNYYKNIVILLQDNIHYLRIFLGAELAIFLEPLHLHCKDTIIIPVNSNENPEVPGGTHWLVCSHNGTQLSNYHANILRNYLERLSDLLP